MNLSKYTAAAATALCAFMLVAADASAAPGEVDRSFADGGRLLVAPLGPLYRFEQALDFAAGPKGETYVLRRGTNCQEVNCGADLLVTRYRFDGSLDTSFGQGGTAKALGTQGYNGGSLAVDSLGRPLVSAAEGRILVVRLARDGSVEDTFATQTSEFCGCFASTADVGFAADGDLVVSGRVEEWFGPNGPPQDRRGWAVFLVARFTPDGQPDPSFADGGQGLVAVRGEVSAVAVQPDGGLLLGGSNEGKPLVRRVGSNGRLGARFGAGLAKALANRGVTGASANSVIPKANGGAVAFVSSYESGRFRNYVVVLDKAGRLMPRFGRRGLRRLPLSMPAARAVRDPRGRMIVEAGGVEGNSSVMRLRADGRVDRAFGGGRPIEFASEYSLLAVGGSSRPMLFDFGNRSFRSYSPPKPLILRLLGGAGRHRPHR